LNAPGLYIHVPFCSTVCPYCDFAVRTDVGALRATFLEDLLLEAERAGWNDAFDTIYLGGGTASRLTTTELGRLLEGLRERLPIADEIWIQLEVNPEDVSPATAHAWRQLGVRAVSLGAQSLDPLRLRFLGRTHTPDTVRGAVDALRLAAIESLSIDLIYGLPGDSASTWRGDLEAAVALGPDHLSCYQLTFHEGTRFGRRLRRGEVSELASERQAELFLLTHARLAELGYPAYEISSFASDPVHRSRHNQKYWDHTPYLGLGPSAHSFDGRSRWWNLRRLELWGRALRERRSPIEESEELTPEQRALEAVLLSLRTAAGIDLEGLRTGHGIDLVERNRDRLERLRADGCAVLSDHHLRLTARGLAIADGIARDLAL